MPSPSSQRSPGPRPRRTRWAIGLALVALGLVIVAMPFLAASLLPLVGGVGLLVAAGLEGRAAFVDRGPRGRALRLLGAGGLAVAGLLVFALPGLAVTGAALLIGAVLVGNGVAQIAAGWRSIGGRGALSGVVLGLLTAAIGAAIAVQWPLSGAVAIGVFLGVRLLAGGWATLAGCDEGGDADRRPPGEVPADVAESPFARAIWVRVDADLAHRRAGDRRWIALFLLVFLAIHVGRMDASLTMVGILSPLGAVAGDALSALLVGLLLVLPGIALVRRITAPLARRIWRRLAARPDLSALTPLERLQATWLARRVRIAAETEAALSSPGGALERGLVSGVPLIAVLVATNPIWGFSWYFNTENWVTGLWEVWAARRVETWRVAMDRALDESYAGQVSAGDRRRIVIDGVDGEADFAFVVIGDPGEGDPSQQVLRDRLLAVADQPEVRFVVVASDVVYPAGEMKDYETNFYLQFKGVTKPILAIPGNHDWYDALDGFVANFYEPLAAKAALEARTAADHHLTSTTSARIDGLVAEAARLRQAYGIANGRQRGTDFEISTDTFTLLAVDTGIERTIDDDQLAWFRAALDRSRGTFLMAIVGHPLYAAGKLQATEGRFAEIRAMLEAAGARLVMGGDTHDFEYYLDPAREAMHFVVGGGGAYLSIGSALDPPASPSLPDWGTYPSRTALVSKLDQQTPWWKRPIWTWVKHYGAWPSTVETLSGIFDFNRAPFFQSFVEVRVEPSRNRVTVLPYGADGRLRWRDLGMHGAAPAGAAADDFVEFVLAMPPRTAPVRSADR